MLLEKLQNEIKQWIGDDYKGVKPETLNILEHAKQINFLHKPQIEALETYVYLKEIKNNKPLVEIFKSFYKDEQELLLVGLGLSKNKAFDYIGKKKEINDLITEKLGCDDYTSQLYALTMGAGKTLLMGIMMIYDFILSFNYPDDKRFAKNVLVFAPDKTIIESLKEIRSFDFSKIIPKAYEDIFLNIKYHYLEDTKTELSLIGSYNIVISNSQKIILKTQHSNNLSLLNDVRYLEQQENENKRLREIRKLNNLIVFVDEAHHAFGENLEGNLKKVKQTINHLHKEGNTDLVGVVNLTGTPYLKGEMISETVYYFGLKEGIEKGILKQVNILNFENIKDQQFINNVIKTFFDKYGDKKLDNLDNKLPKLAFYAPNIEELQTILKPMIDKALIDVRVDQSVVLEYHTEAEKNKDEFLKLDTPESKKQIILLVGKGTEGWNCKSLTATALFRKPKSPIFVLQSTTRCLRAIGNNQIKASIFLSNENYKTLDQELKNNFKIDISEINNQEQEQTELEIKIIKRKKLIVKREVVEILSFRKADIENIKISLNDSLGIKKAYMQESYINLEGGEARYNSLERKEMDNMANYTYYEVLAVISRYTHISFLEIKEILENNSLEGNEFIKSINKNTGLIDYIIDVLLKQVFEYKENIKEYSEEIELAKAYPFKMSINSKNNHLVIYKKENSERLGFHINPYNFDSTDEKDLFLALSRELENDEAIKDVYFTGGVKSLLHNEFYFDYYNPSEKRMAKYFPDFLIETTKSRYLVIEVKGEDKQMDYEANKKTYEGKKEGLFNEVFSKEVGFNEFKKHNKAFDYKIVFNAKLQDQQRELFNTINKLSF